MSLEGGVFVEFPGPLARFSGENKLSCEKQLCAVGGGRGDIPDQVARVLSKEPFCPAGTHV